MQALTILRILPLLALLLAMTTLTVEAATYYIDYSAGNDANSGQTKTAAWKRHPYMKGFLGGSRSVSMPQFQHRFRAMRAWLTVLGL